MATEMISPKRLGELAAVWAPEVPPEVIGAVFKLESAFGQNPNSYTPNPTSNVGPGQIKTAPGSYQAGDPRSLFDAFFPTAEIGRKGNPVNPEDTAISALRKMQSDYAKGKGDLGKFAGNYLGWGRAGDANGTTAPMYTNKLVEFIGKSKTDPHFKSFIEGATDPSLRDTASIPQFSLPSMSPGPVAPGGFTAKANALLSPTLDTKQAIEIAKGMQFDIEALINTTIKIGKDKAEAIGLSDARANQVADMSKEVLGIFGMDPTALTSTLRIAAKDMQQELLGAVTRRQAMDNQLKSDPVYAVLNSLSGGIATQHIRADIENKLKNVANVADKLDRIQVQAQKATAAGIGTLAKFGERETELRMEEARNASLAQAQKLKLDYNYKAEKFVADVEKTSFSQSVQAMNLQSQALQRDQQMWERSRNLDIREANLAIAQQKANQTTDPNSLEARVKAAQVKKLEAQLAEDQQNELMLIKLGEKFDIPTAEVERRLKKDPTLTFVAGDDLDKPKMGTIDYLRRQGKLDPRTQKLQSSLLRPGTILAPAAELSAEEVKAAKERGDKSYWPALNAKADAVFERAQAVIVNDGTEATRRANPLAANFWGMVQVPQSAAVMKTMPNLMDFQKTKLAQLVQTKFQTQDASKLVPVADQDILGLAAQLATTPGVGPGEAARQASLYFKGAVEFNNMLHQFDKAGFPAQTKYGVPVRAGVETNYSASGLLFQRATSAYGEVVDLQKDEKGNKTKLPSGAQVLNLMDEQVILNNIIRQMLSGS